MKKALILGTVLASFAGMPAANAGIIIQPAIIIGAPEYVEPAYVPPPEVVVAAPVYPYHHDHHHHYNWRYWHGGDRYDHDRR